MTEKEEINDIKQLNNVREQPVYKVFNYKRDCGKWVQFVSGRKKMKLRKYIRTMAMSINKINGIGDEVNRQNLKENYNNWGFEGVKKYMNEELKTIERVVTN